ncbi:MAG: hypothetical protein AAFW81_04585 [Pseudomonadota bacterium]
MAFRISRKLLVPFAAAATALFISAPTPASAGGYFGHFGYAGGYYGGPIYGYGYRGHFRRGFRHRHFRHRHYHRRGGGGRAAAIALGAVGGAIIINELAEARAERRFYETRYPRAYDPYATRVAPSARSYDDRGAFQRGFEEGYAEGRAADLEDRAPRDLREGDVDDRDLENRLDGARSDEFRRDGGPEPIRFSAAAAYEACMTHARAALSERGFRLAAPPDPDTAEDVGAAWKMTATVSAQARDGESWSRAMYCEADADRVYLLELI